MISVFLLARSATSQMMAMQTCSQQLMLVACQKTHDSKKKPVAKKPMHHIVRHYVTADEAEQLGAFKTVQAFTGEICIREIPFALALHKCFYTNSNLVQGDTFVLSKSVILALKDRAVSQYAIEELRESSIKNIDSIYLFKDKRSRKNPALCNFTAFIDSGSYDIPKTGASILVPGKLSGVISHNANSRKLIVYLHTKGVRLQLPLYAKALTFGLVKDMDIGIMQLDKEKEGWTASLLYVNRSSGKPEKSGWLFNVTECNKIRAFHPK